MQNDNKAFGRSNWFLLVLFGMIGQIAWSVENMYFNLFVFEEVSSSLEAITLMVQLSGVVATVTTLVAGTLSDKLGNRRSFISFGYAIWGVTVALFGFVSPELVAKLFSVGMDRAVIIALAVVIIGDCVMTFFGSSANDAAFNAWVTDNTTSAIRGKVEGILSILPLAAMLVVAGGFGILVEIMQYKMLFLALGVVITASGIFGIFFFKDKSTLQKNGSMRDIVYGFRPSVIKANAPLYVTLVIVLVYGIACQIFMPYMIIYMKTYLGFSVIGYSVVFGLAIALGAAVNLYLTRLSDKLDKVRLIYFAAAVMSAGLFGMYFSNGAEKSASLVLFGCFGFVMITGYIFISALSGSLVRDYTPEGDAGKLQGVRMVFGVLLPMLFGPMIGNAINAARAVPLPEGTPEADAMTTLYIPAPEIFLAAAIVCLVIITIVPALAYCKRKSAKEA